MTRSKRTREPLHRSEGERTERRWLGLSTGEIVLSLIGIFTLLGAFVVPEVRHAFGLKPEGALPEVKAPAPPTEEELQKKQSDLEQTNPEDDQSRFKLIPLPGNKEKNAIRTATNEMGALLGAGGGGPVGAGAGGGGLVGAAGGAHHARPRPDSNLTPAEAHKQILAQQAAVRDALKQKLSALGTGVPIVSQEEALTLLADRKQEVTVRDVGGAVGLIIEVDGAGNVTVLDTVGSADLAPVFKNTIGEWKAKPYLRNGVAVAPWRASLQFNFPTALQRLLH